MLEFNQNQKPDKAPFIIYADLKYLIEMTDRCKNNPENSITTKAGKHISSGYSMSIMSSFKSIKNNRNIYRYKDFMKKFCESLREHTIKIINFKKKKMKLLTKEQKESYENAKTCYICKEIFENKCVKIKNIEKLEITVIIQGNIEVLHIGYVI